MVNIIASANGKLVVWGSVVWIVSEFPYERDCYLARLQICPPKTVSETKPQMVPRDLNIGFQGLALIEGQIYNSA